MDSGGGIGAPGDHRIIDVTGVVQVALEKEIGDPALLAWRRPGLNLMEDLGSIIGLHAHTDIHHAQQLPAPEKAQAWAVRLHEAHMAHWQQRIAYLMVAFEQFLRSHWL